MNKKEAQSILCNELEIFQKKQYCELKELLIKSPFTFEKKVQNKTVYQIEVSILWDDKKGKDIRVIGSIDDGGWRSYFPITDSFIKKQE